MTRLPQKAVPRSLQLLSAGTIAYSVVLRCKIELTRSRMRELDTLFEIPLHH